MTMTELPATSINICRPTLRGVHDIPAQKSWFPLWMVDRHRRLAVSPRPQLLFYGDIGHGEHLAYGPGTTRVFLTGENIKANWDEADYALTHERVWNERHWRAPLWRHFYDPSRTVAERRFDVVKGRVDRFCNFIYSNPLASERIRFFNLLNQRKAVDSAGRLLNNIGGPVKDKRAFLARCKFTIAFENESADGYATEKIIEPLLVGSIPIYYGDPNIELDFNPDCLINVHRYSRFEEVVERVLEIDGDERLWEKYVTAPIFTDNRIPDCLSDYAFLNFFDRMVSTGPRIGPFEKQMQSIRYHFKSAARTLRESYLNFQQRSWRRLKRTLRAWSPRQS